MALLPENIQAEKSNLPLSEGYYEAKIVGSEIRHAGLNASDRNGKTLRLAFEIENRTVWKSLNIINKSDMAVEIANRFLAECAYACGIDSLSDSDELHNIKIGVFLKKKDGDKYFEVDKVFKLDDDFMEAKRNFKEYKRPDNSSKSHQPQEVKFGDDDIPF